MKHVYLIAAVIFHGVSLLLQFSQKVFRVFSDFSQKLKNGSEKVSFKFRDKAEQSE